MKNNENENVGKSRILSLLGLARKAGKVVFSEDMIRKEVERNKVRLLIIAEDASDNSKRMYISMAENWRIEKCTFGSKEEIAQAIGKVQCAAVAVTNKGFAKKINEYINIEKNRRNVDDR